MGLLRRLNNRNVARWRSDVGDIPEGEDLAGRYEGDVWVPQRPAPQLGWCYVSDAGLRFYTQRFEPLSNLAWTETAAVAAPDRGALAFMTRADQSQQYRYVTGNGDLYAMLVTHVVTFAPRAGVALDPTLTKIAAAVGLA